MKSQPKITAKLTLYFVVAVLLLTTVLGCNHFAKADKSERPVILLDKGTVSDGKVEIIATLQENSGISGMTLTLDYDSKAMTLTKVTDGVALSKLNPVHSATVAVRPYKINYSGAENDFTTGVLLRFEFDVNSGAEGTYNVSLKAQPNTVTYLQDNQVFFKSLISNTVSVTLRGQTAVVQPNNDGEPMPPNDTWKIVVAVVAPVVGGGLAVLVTLLILKKGSRKKDGKKSK